MPPRKIGKTKKETKPRAISEVKDISETAPDMNDSMVRHSMGDVCASVRELGCNRLGVECIHINDCEIKRFFDGFLWDALEMNTICTVEINYCGHFEKEKDSLQKLPKMDI